MGQSTFGLTGLNAQGNFYSQQTGTYATGQQVYYYSGAFATPILTGPSVNYSAPLNTQAYAYNPVTSVNTTIPSATTSATAIALGVTGDVIATQLRGFNTQSSFGNDAYIYTPATNSTTIINDQGILGVTNTAGTYTGTLTAPNTYAGTIFYSTYYSLYTKIGPNYSASYQYVPQYYRTATPTAVNSVDEVVGSVNRYTGLAGTSNPNLGTDAFLYNPLNIASPVTIIGLTATANSYLSSYSSGSNSYVYGNFANKALALNSSGSVVGTSARYQSTASSSSAGQDTWLYTTAGSSTPIGLIGTVATPTAVSSINEYYSPVVGAYTQESSNVVSINITGTIAGTTVVYAGPGSSSTLGQEAWAYTPVGGGGTATGYGTSAAGTYVQLGLTSIAGQTAAGATPATATIGYANSAGYHSSTLTSLSSTGNAVGTSTRYFSDSTSSGVGADAYFYNSTTGISTKITPASSALSNYVSSAGISSSSALYLNNGIGSAAVAAGLQTRYAPGTTTSAGTDAFASVNGTSYVIASPALLAGISTFSAYAADFTTTEYFTSSVNGVTDAGEVFGYFTAYTGATTATPIGTYYFDWTLAGGVTLLTSTSRTALVDPLSSSTAFSSLNAFQVYADAAGNVYGTTGSFGGGTHAFEVSPTAGVPEPASLGLIAAGSLLLLRRRAKR